MKQTVMAGVLLAASLLSVGSARAQIDSREGIALQNQILELRHQLQTMQQGGSYLGQPQPYPAPPPPPPSGPGQSDLLASLVARMDSLEQQVRELRGHIDTIENTVQRQGEDLGKQVGDLNFRLQNLEGGRRPEAYAPPRRPEAYAPPPGSPPPAAMSPPPSALGTLPENVPPYPPSGQSAMNETPGPPPRPTSEVSLQSGYAALARHDYPGAAATAQAILAGNRTSPRAYDAQYLLAEALAGQHDWSRAAIAYDDTYNRNRTGPHAQEALLGLARALVGLGDKKAACGSLQKLHNEFPNLKPELREPAASLHGRAGCA
jgi:TolA-binding protein